MERLLLAILTVLSFSSVSLASTHMPYDNVYKDVPGQIKMLVQTDICGGSKALAAAFGYEQPAPSLADQVNGIFIEEAKKEKTFGERRNLLVKKRSMSPDEIDDEEVPEPDSPLETKVNQAAFLKGVSYWASVQKESPKRLRSICGSHMTIDSVGEEAQVSKYIKKLEQCYVDFEVDYMELNIGYKLIEAYSSLHRPFQRGLPSWIALFRRTDVMVDVSTEARKFSQVVAETFPGSSFNCISETGTFVNGSETQYYNRGKLLSVENKNPAGILEKYGFSPGQVVVSISDGFGGNGQSIVAILNLNEPEKSYINDLKLNFSANESKTLRQKNINVSQNRLMEAATKLYFQQFADERDLPSFMGALILLPEAREELLKFLATN